MFPKCVDRNGRPRPGSTQKEIAVLTAYNGSNIPQHGSVQIQCAYKGELRCVKFSVVTSKRPTILGLPSIQDSKLVTLQSVPYQFCNMSTSYSFRRYLNQLHERFDRIGNHIVHRPNNHLIVHAPRKSPIHMRDEIKTELGEMVSQGIIHKVEEPTDWVDSFVYEHKRNGKLCLGLDSKDLKKDIMRCHHKTPTREEPSHILSGIKFLSKLDAKNGYGSIKLDRQSDFLTTFNSSFQQRIDMIIEKSTGALALIDDAINYGKTKEEHNYN